MCKYEFYKIIKKGMFFFLTIALLAANLVLLYTNEKNTMRYQCVYENKNSYRAFLEGTAENFNTFYQLDMDEQIQYVDSYNEFIQNMDQRAEKLKGLVAFSDKNGFVYRNLQKTWMDYEKLGDITIKPDNCYGIRVLAGYERNIIFLIMYLAILLYYIVLRERQKNLLVLIKVNKNGHAQSAIAKMVVVVAGAIVYSFIQGASSVGLIGYLYGYGDFSRSLQSVSIFRNCTVKLTVGQYLWMTILLQILVAIFLSLLFYILFMVCKSGVTVGVSLVVVLSVEYLMYHLIPISAEWNGLKCVNLFYYWSSQHVLGDYVNLNVFGYPVSRDNCTLLLMLLSSTLFTAGGVIAFARTCQICKESSLERMVKYIREKCHFLPKHTILLNYEFYKVFVQQKKGILVILLLVWGICELCSVFGVEKYSSVEEASYHSYMQQWHGEVTDETISYIEGKEKYFEELGQELCELQNVQSGEAYLRKLQLQHEWETDANGFWLMSNQFHQLEEQSDSIYSQYLIDEVAYWDLWEDVNSDIVAGVIGCVAVVLMISGIYSLDEKKKMVSLLASAVNGRKKLNRCRLFCGIICAAFSFLAAELPLFCRYYKIDFFTASAQRICDFTNNRLFISMSVTSFVLLTFALKFMVYLLVAAVTLWISSLIKNEMVTNIIMIGIVGVAMMLLYRAQMDVNTILFRILQSI